MVFYDSAVQDDVSWCGYILGFFLQLINNGLRVMSRTVLDIRGRGLLAGEGQAHLWIVEGYGWLKGLVQP